MTIHRFPGTGPRALLAVVAFAAFAQSANAALFDDEEARRRIESTNQRLSAVQKQLEDRVAVLEQQLKAQGLVDLFNQNEQMRADIAKLRGQIEVLTYELEQSQKRQRDLYVDLDTRLRKIESAPAASPPPAASLPPAAGGGSADPALSPGMVTTPSMPGAPVPSIGAPPGALPPGGLSPGRDPSGVPVPSSPSAGLPPGPIAGTLPPRTVDAVAEQRNYHAALDQFKRGDYSGAIGSFGTFVKTFPRSPLAASAQYWIGNAQYARRDYRGAIATQRQLLQSYPDSSKAPDALLNIASAQADLNDTAAARRTLEELISRYPSSEAATKARQRLGQR
jgi:tol-pal system protein YbgF